MTTHVLCDVCGEGHVASIHGHNEIEHKGGMYQVPFVMSRCDECGSDYASAADMRQNKRAVVELRKGLDGLLTGHEIFAIRSAAGLTQGQAAKLFGGGPVAFSKYESGDVTQSLAMDKLIRVAAQVPSAMAWLAHYADEHEIATDLCCKEVDRISALVDVALCGKNTKAVVHAVLSHVLLDSPVSCYAKVFVDEVIEEGTLVTSDPNATATPEDSSVFGWFKPSGYDFGLSVIDDTSNEVPVEMTYRLAA
ncbi:type II toxin-antitoxin system MqsA family antitoxin [Cupriavidus sp. D39]|uniref:type II toxin-antitoxin system MqsA family antitoxin n=1 Tax=Cupriavidus sp. D39 TaxID=2997877 RepID=UPI00226D6B64|nr:type II toxin-antitoxin system MqsA family antitoxin [Cupriavidus sp. D39]MCY0852602.1 type II toxin-antitoxin system MqsA family antitoxin [Cupriavidus sp. D39]